MQLYYSSKLRYTECVKKEGEHMKQLTITIDDFLYDFYHRLARENTVLTLRNAPIPRQVP